ncbi:MAG: hypothetical protein KatS3mg055_2794 [Chloroflexus sp.]|uniref:hypothetical protein n=1 Tax=Chloroflexus sp. TaxID=1904827 RepID=UPI0021DCA781|nr:hypothetical protein [Chloroflexus sp.]GIV90276.1 MAG: hypothetical protein KatS3mg055_2794 [Chloroflexus sp.]
MSYSPQEQQPVYVTRQISPETEGAASIARWLEILFGIFGLLGVGHVYTGRIAVGIIAMVVWWIYMGVAVTISALTAGLASCLFGPLYLAVPIISGIQASTYMKQRGGTGSWQSVGIVV